ncbi:MAG TPA: class I SAM-dependent methyltransferase [Xanthobacteraceae bacterium]|nr:class I SAM-dependent methyltransferase [Xanthobacteraceae bacterium]
MTTRHAANLDDYRWLVSTAAEPWLAQAATADARSTVSLTADLRRQLSAERTHLVLEQVELRRRARAKFAAAGQMWFTAVGLEQATDEIIARYKAQRFATQAAVADLCCGIGGDLLALAERGPVVGVDRDPLVTLLAAANVQAVAPQSVASFRVSDVEAFDVCDFASWHIDPDRRPEGRRTTRVELHEPGPAVIDRLRARQAEGAVKLAPAATLPDAWSNEAELEWISRGGECRQLVCWFGALARDPGRRRATILDSRAAEPRTILGVADEHPPHAASLGEYLYEPDAAVLAAGLTATLAAEHALAAITPGVGYLTGDRLVTDAALAGFAIRDVLPLDRRRLRAALRAHGIGRLEIKKRGVDVDIEKLRQELKLSGDSAATLILLPRAGHPTAIVAERI